MFYEGVGNLFPWNALINASSYYAERFCGTSFESSFENYFSLTYTLSQTFGLGLAVLFQDRLTLNQKVVIPLGCWATLFAITTLLVIIQDLDPTLLFFLTLITCFLCGSFGALLSGGLFSLGAMLPPAYTGALMNGQGLAGLIVSVSAILTSWAASAPDNCTDDNAEDDDGECSYSLNVSALAYFLIATFILMYYMARAMGEGQEDILNPMLSDTSAHGINNNQQQQEEEEEEGKKKTSAALRIDNPLNHDDSTLSTYSIPFDEQNNFNNSNNNNNNNNNANNEKLVVNVDSIVACFRKIWIPAVSVWFTFSVTIGLFPSLTVFIESTENCKSSNRFYNDLFTPFMFLLFNLFDFIGRVSAGVFRNVFTTKNIWMAPVARTVFFPLFLLCNITDSKLPVVFNNDAFPFLFMIFMAITNGYVASTCMMMGPSLVSNNETGLVGTIMVFCLTSGLLTGACISFLTVYISQGSV
eukprot:scaffold3486_cov185-Ochromonas_danica.AAC.11